MPHTITGNKSMTISSRDGYIVDIQQIRGTGANWIVRVYRKFFFFRKRISSDWFLDEGQATLFARQLASELSTGQDLQTLRGRSPGWTLHRAPH